MKVNIAQIEALADMGSDAEEIAVELGYDLADIEKVLAGEVVATAMGDAITREEFYDETIKRGKRARSRKAGGPDSDGMPGMATVVKLARAEHPFISWTGEDARIAELCDRMVGAGRKATVQIKGRDVSRAGLARLLAEQMCLIRMKKRLHEVDDRQCRTLIDVAILAVNALEAVEAAALT